MTDYDRGRNDGLILGIAQRGVLVRDKGSSGAGVGIVEIEGAQIELYGQGSMETYVKTGEAVV